MTQTRKEEIETVLSVLREYWMERPQLRLGQIVSNMANPLGQRQHVSISQVADELLLSRLLYRDGSDDTYVCMHPGASNGEVCAHCKQVARFGHPGRSDEI